MPLTFDMMNEEILEVHRKGAVEAIDDNEVDELMVDMVKWLNTIPGVATEMCCQGHCDSGDTSRNDAWVMMLCTIEADALLTRLWRKWVNKGEHSFFQSCENIILGGMYFNGHAGIEKKRFNFHIPRYQDNNLTEQMRRVTIHQISASLKATYEEMLKEENK